MKIIIIGDGKVGYSLAENLSKEGHDVTIIDKNIDALKKASEKLDVMCIKGNGVSARTLLDAGVREADLLVAATASDEINMVCCLTAKKLGAQNTIARIRDPEYANELSMLKAELGLNMVINPEQAAADEIARLLRFNSAVNIESFSKGRVDLVEIKMTEKIPIVGMNLKSIMSKFALPVLIGAVTRDDEVSIPDGSFTVRNDDTLHILGRPTHVFNFCKSIGLYSQKIRNVMVVGGGRIAYYLTGILEDMGMKVKIIELDRNRCLELTELLPKTLIINGDGTDEDLLLSENLKDMDAFVALTGRDEENLIASMLAKQSGLQKVLAKVNRMNYLNVVKSLGLDRVVSPKLIVTNYIIKYVRGLHNAYGDTIQTLYRIIDGKAEVMEFIASSLTRFLNIPLRKLNIEKGTLVGVIVRKNEIIIPRGDDCLKLGDSVIIITKNKNISDLNDIISGGFQSELQNGIKKLGDYISM